MESDNQRESFHSEEQRPTASFTVLFGRLLWFIGGPMVLFMLSAEILRGGTGWLTVLDLAYLAVTALMIWGRWVEQRSGNAKLATGEPATWAHFRRYVTYLVPIAAAFWVAANGVGNHVLKE
jgi:hypothetical protein